MSDDQYEGPENLIANAINAAEEVLDPLEGLDKKTATDPGAPFTPEVLERLAALKKDNRPRVRGAARTVEGGRLPGDGTRRGHCRGKW